MFARSLSVLRRRVPKLPPDLADVDTVSRRLEAFNREATTAWLRHLAPVCLSLMRVPVAVH